MLTPEELERYARHIVLREIGGPGQGKLKAARVLVVGAGGLGSPVLMYLAAAGLGTIGIIDDDKVSLSNLQRQVIFKTADVGKPKAETAAHALRQLNPAITVTAHSARLDVGNALDLINRYDLVVDGSDNFETRYLTSDACYFAKRPLVTGALGVFDGSITTIRAHEKNAAGKPNPTYRCLFPVPPPPGTIPACAEAGILGALPGILGSMMALEVVREIVGFGEGLVGRLLMVDARDMRFEMTRYDWDANNPLSGERKLAEVKARLTDGNAIRLRDSYPVAGFSGATVLDAKGRLLGIMETRHAQLASAEPAPPPVRLVPSQAIRDFLTAHNVAMAASGDARAAVVRIICMRSARSR